MAAAAKLGGSAQPLQYRQGIVLAWDPATLESEVNVGGSSLFNLPVLGVAEAASLGPGSVVGLLQVGGSWAIVGRLVIPGTAQALDAITQLGQRNLSNVVATFEDTTSVAFTDLATEGPVVTIRVGASGKVLVMLSAYIYLEIVSSNPAAAHMAFTVAGANTLAADISRALTLEGQEADAIAATRTVQLEGLSPGLTTFKAVYNMGGGQAGFSGRVLTVQAL